MKKIFLFLLMGVIPVSASAQPECQATPIPALYETWKREVVGEKATEKQVKARADQLRPNLPSRDPFTSIAYDTLERKRRNETVVWEDDRIMVVLDFGNNRKFLVVPKTTMNFISDASPVLRENLAIVAARTSDAIRFALSAPCDSLASIYIHPPGSLGVRQLHIHVEPKYNFRAITQAEFNLRVKKHLAKNVSLKY